MQRLHAAVQSDSGPARRRIRSRGSSTGQICTEEMALLGALWQVRHGHDPRRRQHAPVHGHRASSPTSRVFGFDAPPFTYADFEESDVIVFIGSNLCIAHPIMWQRVLRNRTSRRSSSSIRARPRRRWPRRSISRCDRSPISRCSTASRICSCKMAGSIASSSTQHTTGFEEFAAFVATVHAGQSRRGHRSHRRRACIVSPKRFIAARRCRSGGRWA